MDLSIATLNLVCDKLSITANFLRERKCELNTINSLNDTNAQVFANKIDTESILNENDVELMKKDSEFLKSFLNTTETMNGSNIQASTSSNNNGDKFIQDFILRKNYNKIEDFIEVRIAVVGNVDAGKSTLLGCLTHGILDDGRGHARKSLFRHKHEIESGRTSSVGNDILGFNSDGTIVNQKDGHHGKNQDWEEICRISSKVITFIDLAGHEKYLKTTVFGMTGHAPDFCMLMIGSNMGIVGMTKEHLGLALALNIPVFVVLTKIDMCPPNVYQENLRILQKILKSPGCRKIAYLIENKDDVITCSMNFTSERLCPIFQISNVTGQNMDLLKMFLNLLNARSEYNFKDDATEFQIDEIYSVPGVGTIVSGTCYRGQIRMNDGLVLGPDLSGQFRPVQIKGIHRKRLPVKECHGGQTGSLALKKVD
jgi:GTPase